MKSTEINALLKKADELRALFILGQKVIPFLEEIFVFVSEIQPLLDEINNSITENLRRMPSASKQLSKVTEATELATTEIMDLVDGILFNLDTITSNIDKVNKITDLQSQKSIETLEVLYQAINNGVDVTQLLPDLRTAIDNLGNNINHEKDVTIFNTKEIIKSIQLDSSSIMMSLQVQDITSQQIAAVNKLLETLQTKLESILKHFKNTDLGEMIVPEYENEIIDTIRVSKLHREIAFDPHAVDSILNKGFKQNEVDEYIRQSKEDSLKASNNEPTTQDDIDKLFENHNVVDNPVFDSESYVETNENQTNVSKNSKDDFVSVDDIVKENGLDNVEDFEAFSQDDIDKIFN